MNNISNMLFRGKRKDNGKWVYGYFYKQKRFQYIDRVKESEERCFILFKNSSYFNIQGLILNVEVIPETVAPYIGRKDKHGNKIYRDDILATSNNNPKYDIWSIKDYGYTTVIWSPESCGFIGDNWNWTLNPESVYSIKFVEIVGNIHDK